MCLNFKQINTLLDFFKKYAKDKQKGISNLVNTIEYYHDQKEILIEKPSKNYDVNEYLTDGQELRAKEIG